ncbi:hypothetical protein Agabi119p4_2613 [Agaricus bisporus var. burnettii]|uniref:Uncharacterized protein n=1 Tax=Agaricus bisporus var. burnettii TaxID=192524 RepID=A0A8H7F9L5_AGABI|nr:hypothetical protein Agabi119p4_2613 [Agaricus bisporus var. burnettii]
MTQWQLSSIRTTIVQLCADTAPFILYKCALTAVIHHLPLALQDIEYYIFNCCRYFFYVRLTSRSAGINSRRSLWSRWRQQDDAELVSGPFRGTAVLNKEYLAGKIVPFGAPVAEFPSHFRPPGERLRLAIRRPDGAWDFTDPSEPFTPSGVSDIYSSPTCSTTNFESNTGTRKSAVMEYKEQESAASRMIRLGYDARDSDLASAEGLLPHPPPAYRQESIIGPYVTYQPPSSQKISTRNASRQD